MTRTGIIAALTLLASTAWAQNPTLTLPQEQIPLQPPQFAGETADQAYDDPCELTLLNQFYMNLAAGAGLPVADAATEANTGALVGPTISTEQNTDISAQLAYNKCLAEQQAWLNNIQTGTEAAPIDNAQDAGPESQAPGANE